MAKKTYTPRYKPKKTGEVVKLVDRDFEIFAYLLRFRVLSHAQIQDLFFMSYETARVRLRKLYNKGYIRRIPRNDWVEGGGRVSTLYVLNRKGAEALKTKQPVVWHYTYMDLSDNYLKHTVPLNEVMVRVTLAAREADYTLHRWRTQADLKKNTIKTQVRNRSGRSKVLSFAPDAYFVIRVPKQSGGDEKRSLQFPFFLEWDGTSQRKEVIQQKIKGYLAYYERGQYGQDYGHKHFRVLFVAQGSRRIENLKQWTEEVNLPGTRHFFFTTLDALTKNTIFFEPVWYRAGEQNRAALIRRR